MKARSTVTLSFLVGLLLSGLLPSPANASEFSDVSPDDSSHKTITWLASTGIAYGYSDGTFRPLNPVTRGAMSAFLYRFHSSPSYTPLMRSPFRDVPLDDPFYKSISWLSSSGITAGYSDHTFRTTNPVTRGSMAAFLYRTAGSPAYTPPSTSAFSDVKTTDTFYKVISWLASTGITVGYSDGEYKQARPVTRGAMAAFLYRFNNVNGAPLFSPPANPGDTRNCGDFATWAAAQSWYETYFPYHGDIAGLDGNNDGIVCIGLPGAP